MYGLQDWAAVQRVYKQTHSKRETAKILKISRNTVKKLLELKKSCACGKHYCKEKSSSTKDF